MNIRYSKKIIQKCREQNWNIKKFDRRKEPDRIKLKEGTSLEWGIGSDLVKNALLFQMLFMI